MGPARHAGSPAVILACVAGLSCGRIGFGSPEAVGGDGRAVSCAEAVFSVPGASSLMDDFTTGAFTDQWSPIAPCIQEVGGEIVASPSPSGSYCHAWTRARYHLACDRV